MGSNTRPMRWGWPTVLSGLAAMALTACSSGSSGDEAVGAGTEEVGRSAAAGPEEPSPSPSPSPTTTPPFRHDDAAAWSRTPLPVDGPAGIVAAFPTSEGYVVWSSGNRPAGTEPLSVMTSPDGRTWAPGTVTVTEPTPKRVTGVAERDGRLVAVGFTLVDDTPSALVLLSDDGGRTWDEVTPLGAFAASDLSLRDVAATDDGFVALAAHNAGGGVFSSPDGRSWTRVTAADALLEEQLPERLTPVDIAAGEDGLVALAIAFSPLGDDGGLAVRDSLVVLTSPDGESWQRELPGPGALDITAVAEPDWVGSLDISHAGVAAGHGRFVAFASVDRNPSPVSASGRGDDSTYVWTSDDGRTWTPAAADDGTFDSRDTNSQIWSLSAVEDGFVAVGGHAEPGPAGDLDLSAGLWYSTTDPSTWQLLRGEQFGYGSPGPVLASSIASNGHGAVVTGFTEGQGGGDVEHLAFVGSTL